MICQPSLRCILGGMSEVTKILSAMDRGDDSAAERLLPLVYGELRKLAASQLQSESAGQTLQPTALVHEAYLKLVDQELEPKWHHRGHFFAAAATAMRRILVDNARRKNRVKRGGGLKRVDLDPQRIAEPELREDLISLDEALAELEKVHPRKATLVNLRYFGGLTMEQAAEALGVSRATAAREWTYARAWLLRRLAR